MPQKPFEIFEEDFRKTSMDYIMFQKGIDTKDFGEKLLERAMYSSYKAFVDELNRHIKTDFTFLLPVEADDKPDWKYMEQYMKDMIDVSKKVIENFELLNIC